MNKTRFLINLICLMGIVGHNARASDLEFLEKQQEEEKVPIRYSLSKSHYSVPSEIETGKGKFTNLSIRCVFGKDYEEEDLLRTLPSSEFKKYPYLAAWKNPQLLQIARSIKLGLGSLASEYTYLQSGYPSITESIAFFSMDELRKSSSRDWISFILSGTPLFSEGEPRRRIITIHSLPIKEVGRKFHIYIKEISVDSRTALPYIDGEVYKSYQPLDLYTSENSLRDEEREPVMIGFFDRFK